MSDHNDNGFGQDIDLNQNIQHGDKDIIIDVKVKGYAHVRQVPLENSTVILHDSPHHTFEYVIKMLTELCRMNKDEASKAAMEVHNSKCAVVFAGTLELCELKVEQILAYGKDPLSADCAGSMTATIDSR